MVGSLTNVAIDVYLHKKVRGIVIIPSESFQDLFSYDGNPRSEIMRSCIMTMKPCACCINTDRADGPGLHWIAVIIFPRERLLFYYDSLLPNREYRVSHELALFMSKMASRGFAVYQNMQMDQGNTFSANHKRVYNDMCGVYASQMIIMLDDAYREAKGRS